MQKEGLFSGAYLIIIFFSRLLRCFPRPFLGKRCASHWKA